MIFFRRAKGKETSHDCYFAGPASLETGNDLFSRAQVHPIEDPLRIPSGIEAITVKSGQQETSHDFYLGQCQIKIMTCLDRGGARLPGDR